MATAADGGCGVNHPLGIIHGLDIEAYHSGPGISKSGLDDMDPPARYYALHLDPKRPERPQTASQRVGQLAHCAILEPEEFGKRYAVGPDCSRANKAWKEWEASLPAGVEAIKPSEYDAAMWQRESVLKLPSMKEILSAGKAEVSAFWEDPYTGVLCRCRPDYAADCGVLLDVKTVGNSSPEDFRLQAARMRYDVQDAFYSEGYGIASGSPVGRFFFLTVETIFPYLAAVHEFLPESKASGAEKARTALTTYAKCLAENTWPNYGSEIHQIQLPAWALTYQGDAE